MKDSLARLNDVFPAEDLLTSPADLQIMAKIGQISRAKPFCGGVSPRKSAG